MSSSFKAAVLSIALLVSVPASAIGLPKLNVRNALKGGFVALVGAGAIVYYFKTQKTESEIAEKKSVRMDEVDPLAQTMEMVNDVIGQDGKDDKLDYVDKATGAIIKEKTPATGFGAVKKFVTKKVMPVATSLYVLNKMRTEFVDGMKFFGINLDSWIPEIPNMSKLN